VANRPIIIKRKKIVGGAGHHGGAWKVAYADFVTAMMAFFLLMWLLNATTEQQKKGLADYFDSRIPISRVSGGGESAFRGDSLTAAQEMARSGGGVSPMPDGRASSVGENDEDPRQSSREAQAESQAFDQVERTLQAFGGESSLADELLEHVRTRVTDEGLVIDVFDTEGLPLFDPDTAEPTAMMEALVDVVAEVADLVSNDIAISGHVAPVGAPDPGAEEHAWTLSAERAQMTRRMLTGAGTDPDRISEVTGRAGSDPVSQDPNDPANRRVQITLKRDFPVR
jgi:chemotaxis protein MotB